MSTFRDDLHLGHSVPMVDTEDIVDGAVTEPKLADDSVSTRTIQDGAVTEPKIAEKAVTEPKLADAAVSTRTIKFRAVTESKIGDSAVSTRTIQNGAVTNPKIANGAVSMNKLDNETQTLIQRGADSSWTPMGDYDVDALYYANDLVFDPVTNSSYLSLRADNMGHAVTDETWWMKVLDGSYVNLLEEELQQLVDSISEGTQQQVEELNEALEALEAQADQSRQDIQDIVDSLAVVQTTGQSASAVMSQKAVTDSLVGSAIVYDETEIVSTLPVAKVIGENNTWVTARGMHGEFVPVVHGKKYRIVVDSSNSGVIAFMTRATQTGVYYAGGATSRTILQPSTNVVLIAPDDANYLYYTQIGTTPATVRVYEIDTIQEEINYIENAVGLNYSVINFVDFNYIINSKLLLQQTSSSWRMSTSMYRVGDDFTIIPTDQTQQYYPVGFDENFHFIRSYADDGMATGTRAFNASSFGVKYIYVAASNRNSMSIDAQTIFRRESIVCAASDTSCKDGADVICPSTDARESLQLAISYGLLTDRKVILMNGRYILNSYITEGGGNACLVASGFTTSTGETDDQYGNRIRFTTIEGSNDVLGWADGAILKVSDTLYESVTDAAPLTVIRGMVTDWKPWENASAISLKNIKVILPSNQKAITCVDFGYTDNARVEHLYCSAFDPLVTPLNVHPDELDIPIANSECVGVKLTFGSNMDAAIYEHISVLGFYAGIDFSGDHAIVNSPTAIYCYYGFTFGKYMHSGGMTQQITIINMTEEHNVCLPIYYARDGANIKVIQILSGNVFWPEKGCQGNIPFDDPRRVAATIPNHNYRGYINYVNSINPSTGWFDTMQSSLPTSYFAEGSEIYMEQKNMAAPPSATSAIRRTWAKGLGMQCFDTTLNKVVFCVVKDNALAWVDANGNIVDS